MKASSSVLLLLAALFSHSLSFADVVRCKGSVEWGKKKVDVRIDVVLPEKAEQIVTLSSEKGEFKEIVDLSPVGTGQLKIIETINNVTNKSNNYKFLLTRKPDSVNSLVGFVLERSYVLVLRADLWAKDKPFTFYNSYWNELVSGKCE